MLGASATASSLLRTPGGDWPPAGWNSSPLEPTCFTHYEPSRATLYARCTDGRHAETTMLVRGGPDLARPHAAMSDAESAASEQVSVQIPSVPGLNAPVP